MTGFGDVYDAEVARVHGFFAHRFPPPVAEDLTQTTFEKALRAWGRYDATRATPATWLLAIARNVMIDHLRADRSTRQVPLEEGDHPATEDRPWLGADPRLAAALRELPEREREVLGLRFGADLDGPQIAAVTGLSLANVQQILSRTLRRLRDALEA